MPKKDKAVKKTIPSIDPKISIEYAAIGLNWLNNLPSSCERVEKVTATPRKRKGKIISGGNVGKSGLGVKKSTSSEGKSISNFKKATVRINKRRVRGKK